MPQPLACGSFSLAVIAGVLPKENRENECMEEVAGNRIRQRRAVASSVARHSLAELRIAVFCLRYARIERRSHKRDRFKIVFHEQIELISRIQPAKLVRPVMRRMNRLDLQLAGKSRHDLAQGAVIVIHGK
jgi:hypothetical protein